MCLRNASEHVCCVTTFYYLIKPVDLEELIRKDFLKSKGGYQEDEG